MKHFAEVILGVLVMILAVVCVWEYTIISSQKKEIKSKELIIDAQAVNARNQQEQIVEKDNTIKLLTMPKNQLPVGTINAQ